MSREVTHDATGPLFLTPEDVDPEKGDIAVCRCGLSDERPFCDGSHRAVEDEGEAVYRYVDGERKRLVRAEFADGTEIAYENPDTPVEESTAGDDSDGDDPVPADDEPDDDEPDGDD